MIRRFLASLLALVFPAQLLAAGAPLDLPSPLWRANSGEIASPDRARFAPPTETSRSLTVAPEPGPWDDSHWVSRFGLPITNRSIQVLLPYGDRLIAGGWFSRIGELEVPGIAAWDGSNWSRLGDLPANYVTELALHGDGLLALAIGDDGPEVWKWRGTEWEALPEIPEPKDQALDLAVLGDRIAVSVGVWDGSGWQPRVLLHENGEWNQLGSLTSSDFGASAKLAWFRGELYAGGGFMIQEPLSQSMVMRWTGAVWEPVGDVAPGVGQGYVLDLEVYGNGLIAAGSFLDDSQSSTPRRFAQWDGTRWTSLDEERTYGFSLMRMRSLDGSLYAVGRFGNGEDSFCIARWDGSRWNLAEDRLRAFVDDVAWFRGRLYAGGILSREGTRPATPLVRREGELWLPTTTPSASMQGFMGWGGASVTSLLVHDGDVIATGHFEFAGAPGTWRFCNGAARWDGSEWLPLGLESLDRAAPRAMTVHEEALYAVGSFTFDSNSSGGGASVVRLEDGAWHPVGDTGLLLNLSTIRSAHGSLFVGGNAEGPFRGIARWDGHEWREVGGGITRGNWISEITEHGDDVIVAGSFEEVGGIPCRNIAAWNPATGWRPLGTGTDDRVLDVLSIGGDLYVAGTFKSAGGVRVGGLTRWNDGQWQAVPSPDEGEALISAIGWFDGQLIASGESIPNRIAALDRNGQWHPLGSGLDQSATEIVTRGTRLFVGGGFSRAGTSPAYGFAEWGLDRAPMPKLSARISAAPNPALGAVAFRYELAERTRTRLEIFDLAGKLVESPLDELQSAGLREWTWTPKDGVRPGVYFARLSAGGVSRTVRIVRIR